MEIKTDYIKHFSNEMAKIAREEMDPQEFDYQEGQETPAKKFKYKYQPWHTMPAGLVAGLGIGGYGGVKKLVGTKDIKATRKAQSAALTTHRASAQLNPRAFLKQQGKTFPTIFAKSKARRVLRNIKRQDSAVLKSSVGKIRDMMKKNKKLAIGVGAAVAVAGPGIALAKNLIERKRQSMPQYQ